MQDGQETQLKKAQITLNDCLACSGCITSAESVLITQQSQEELLRILEENNQLPEVRRAAEPKTAIYRAGPNFTKHKIVSITLVTCIVTPHVT